MEKVIIEITPTGETKVSVECVKGSSCIQTSQAIEQALGGKISDEKTKEYYEREEHATVTNRH